MRYQVTLKIEGTIVVEANSEKEAEELATNEALGLDEAEIEIIDVGVLGGLDDE